VEPAGSLLRLGACLACEFLGDFDCFEKFLGEERPGPFNAGLLVWQPAAPVEMRSVELSGGASDFGEQLLYQLVGGCPPIGGRGGLFHVSEI